MRKKEVLRLPFKPQKSLGQNFLLSSSHLIKIVDSAHIDTNSKVIEIGPGYGFLTSYILAAKPQKIIAIEKDPKLFSWLNSNQLLQQEKLNLLLNDGLEIKWEELAESLPDAEQKFIVIGNLPYNIANKLIGKLVRKQSLFKRLVFLVQKEVAQRWVASNTLYKNKYSSLSITLNYFCRIELLFDVPRNFFKPQPPVDGAVVSFEFKENLPVSFSTESFFTFAKNCFRFRRKTLFNNLKSFHGRELLIRNSFVQLNLDEKTRPQDLSIEQYLNLFAITKGFGDEET